MKWVRTKFSNLAFWNIFHSFSSIVWHALIIASHTEWNVWSFYDVQSKRPWWYVTISIWVSSEGNWVEIPQLTSFVILYPPPPPFFSVLYLFNSAMTTLGPWSPPAREESQYCTYKIQEMKPIQTTNTSNWAPLLWLAVACEWCSWNAPKIYRHIEIRLYPFWPQDLGELHVIGVAQLGALSKSGISSFFCYPWSVTNILFMYNSLWRKYMWKKGRKKKVNPELLPGSRFLSHVCKKI